MLVGSCVVAASLGLGLIIGSSPDTTADTSIDS